MRYKFLVSVVFLVSVFFLKCNQENIKKMEHDSFDSNSLHTDKSIDRFDKQNFKLKNSCFPKFCSVKMTGYACSAIFISISIFFIFNVFSYEMSDNIPRNILNYYLTQKKMIDWCNIDTSDIYYYHPFINFIYNDNTDRNFWTKCEPELNTSEWKTYLNFYKHDLSLLINNDSSLEKNIMSTRYISKLGKKIKYKPLKEGIMSIPKENCILFFNVSISHKKTKNDNNKTREVCSFTGNMPILANDKGGPCYFFGILLPIGKISLFRIRHNFGGLHLLNNQN